MTDTLNNAATSAYLRDLERALGPINDRDRADIVAEIEAHVAERRRDGADTAVILAGLGAPEELAREYVQDHELAGAVRRASPGPLLANLLARSTRSAVALAGGFAASLLYLAAASLLLTAAIKPIAPDHVGLWSGPDGVRFGFVQTVEGGELLGLWFIPLAVAAAIGCYLAGTALMRRCGRWLLERTPAPSAR